MDQPERQSGPALRTCCPCGASQGLNRRGFLEGIGIGGAVLGGTVLSGLTWSALSAAESDLEGPPPRKPLVVKPIFLYNVYQRKPHTSWRSWGGVHTQEAADAEIARINAELTKLQSTADFPLTFLPLSAVRKGQPLPTIADLASADALLVYANDGDLGAVAKLGKDSIFFLRHQSGPVYLNYETISPRFLRQQTDHLVATGISDHDVVVDSLDEVLWRLRALCGLRNTVGARILTVGQPGGWGTPTAPALARDRWKLDIQSVSYDELGKLIEAARKDPAATGLAAKRADAYLKQPGTTLETDRGFVDRAFLLEGLFRKLMARAGCRMMTINQCMTTIMGVSETTACLPLSTLNDDGYLAFCESDFVVIPSGMLLCSIAGRPPFLNDPTYPHDGIITLAHCTAPRKMDGKTLEPARLLTHFESDYGAAPKVEMREGQEVTIIVPDFKEERWVGLRAEIVAHPFLPICRSQIDVRFKCDSNLLAERMPGFHWMVVYGNYTREVAYALKKTSVAWELLG